MAVLLLTAAASALTAGASAFVQIAAAAAATAVGSFIDNRLFGPSMGNTTQEGPRLDSLQVQASTEGAAIPEIAGRVRIAGQIIWATKFKEVATTTTQRSGGGTEVGCAHAARWHVYSGCVIYGLQVLASFRRLNKLTG